MFPNDASTAGRRYIDLAPRKQSMELRKTAKIIFVPMYVITSEHGSSFLSLILEANLCMIPDADGSAPPVHETTNKQKVAFSTSIFLCSYFSFLMDSCCF